MQCLLFNITTSLPNFRTTIAGKCCMWEWSCLGVNKAHITAACLCLSLTGVHIFMFRFQWGNSQCCTYTVSVFSLMLLSAAKRKLGGDGRHVNPSQVTSRQCEVWEKLCREVEAMLTLPHTALTSLCRLEIDQRGSSAKQNALHKQLDVFAVNMRSYKCWISQQDKQQTRAFLLLNFPMIWSSF